MLNFEKWFYANEKLIEEGLFNAGEKILIIIQSTNKTI